MKSLPADFPRYDVLKSNQISASNPGSQQPVSPPWGRHTHSPTGLHRNSVGINERKQSRLSSVRSGITRLQPNRFITSITPTCHAATMWLSLISAFVLSHADAAHPHGVMNMWGLAALFGLDLYSRAHHRS